MSAPDVLTRFLPNTVAGTLSETDILNYTIPVNTFATSMQSIIATLIFGFVNSSGANKSLRLRAYLAGLLVYDDTLTFASDSERRPMMLRLRATSDGGVSGSAEVAVEFVEGYVGATPATGVGKLLNPQSPGAICRGIGPANKNWTTGQVLQITGTLDSTDNVNVNLIGRSGDVVKY